MLKQFTEQNLRRLRVAIGWLAIGFVVALGGLRRLTDYGATPGLSLTAQAQQLGLVNDPHAEFPRLVEF